MKKVMCFAVAASLFIFSCDRNDEPDAHLQDTPAFFPLSVGNYWIYRHYLVEENGDETLLDGMYDSIYISRDTLIGNEVYYVFEGSRFMLGNYNPVPELIVRDSLGYIIGSNGTIYLSSVNFSEVLGERTEIINDQDTVFTLMAYMTAEPSVVRVPAGEFNVINCQYRYVDYLHEKLVRYSDNLFAQGVGEILDSYLFLSQVDRKYEKRLVRYHVTLSDDK